MISQTIRTFYEVKDGAVIVLFTDPVFTPLTAEDKKRMAEGEEMDAENSIEPRTEKGLQA